jgi:putative SOS response-associated peptidase YedK
VESFAEAEGPKGAKTRTWISLPDQDVFAVAGIRRWSEKWRGSLLDGDDGSVRPVEEHP